MLPEEIRSFNFWLFDFKRLYQIFDASSNRIKVAMAA